MDTFVFMLMAAQEKQNKLQISATAKASCLHTFGFIFKGRSEPFW